MLTATSYFFLCFLQAFYVFKQLSNSFRFVIFDFLYFDFFQSNGLFQLLKEEKNDNNLRTTANNELFPPSKSSKMISSYCDVILNVQHYVICYYCDVLNFIIIVVQFFMYTIN